MTGPIEVLQMVNTAIDAVKLVNTASNALKDAELKMRLADALESLANTKFGVIDLREALDAKDREIARLTAALQTKSTLTRSLDAYYETAADGRVVGAPYCSKCWEVDHVQVHLSMLTKFGVVKCPSCKSEWDMYRAAEYPD